MLKIDEQLKKTNSISHSEPIKSLNEELIISRITSLWAFSESALGGILHAFRIPFRGMVISGAAVIFISMIGYFSKKRGNVLKALLMVLIVKGLVSPHTPPAAYAAVILQGILGEILFFSKKLFRLSALLLGIFTLLFSSIQKIFILTIVFGNTLWESIDEFAGIIINNFTPQDYATEFNFSYLLISFYLGLHLLLGALIGWTAGKLPNQTKNILPINIFEFNSFNSKKNKFLNDKAVQKRWRQRPSSILLIAFILVLVIISYFYPELGSNKATEIIFMVLRALLILIIWYSLLGPLALKFFRRFLKKKENLHITEINNIIDSFPHLRALVSYSWKISSPDKGYKRIKTFLTNLISYFLVIDFNES